MLSNVTTSVVAGVGQITLNRPAAFNALTLDMIRDISSALLQWKDDDTVEPSLSEAINRAPLERCAGGDIRFFHALVLQRTPI